MVFEQEIKAVVVQAFEKIYGKSLDPQSVVCQSTRKEFPGDITVVVFGLAKMAGQSPDAVGKALGEALPELNPAILACNLVKGFLNIELRNEFWVDYYKNTLGAPGFFLHHKADADSNRPVLVEYSSPNTNKPLHLGHIRNNLLGYSVAELLKAVGWPVMKVNLVNDRGIHICKSMLAWQKSGLGETPASGGLKGDHLVGKYYVEFDRMYKAQIDELVSRGIGEEDAKRDAPVMQEAREMLRKWESGDAEVIELWKKMNGWVYEGFARTYNLLGVDFDRTYYESEMYLLGKAVVDEGLAKGVFFKKSDGSVWVDLTDEGLDQKLLLRGDGTSVYITQDLGTAIKRFEETSFSRLIYVVGNEQDYHFKVLKLILKKMGYPWWDSLYHLSYNMVDLPSGKMKSREGTVVDADDLMQEMINEAGRITRELGKIENFESEEAEQLYKSIGLGALKYFILKVDPEKRMLFNPAESIDFNGHTGPFIQYTHARIRSVIRKASAYDELRSFRDFDLGKYADRMNNLEREAVKCILRFTDELEDAAERFSPAIIANYVYELAKVFNQFYHECPIVDLQQPEASLFRLRICFDVAEVIRKCMSFLGIRVPEKM